MIADELKSNNKMIGNVYLGKRDFEALTIPNKAASDSGKPITDLPLFFCSKFA